MLKFMVVVYRRPDFSHTQFRKYFEEVHGPLAMKIPGLRRYVQNFAVEDSTRKSPGWDAIIELYFDNRAAMEVAWATPQGIAATADLQEFADLTHTTVSIVAEVIVLP